MRDEVAEIKRDKIAANIATLMIKPAKEFTMKQKKKVYVFGAYLPKQEFFFTNILK